MEDQSNLLNQAKGNVLVESAPISKFSSLDVVRGPELNDQLTFESFFAALKGMGIQGSSVSKAVGILEEMINWNLQDDPEHDADDLENFDYRRTFIYLGFSSSVVSGGCRELIRYLFEHRMINVAVTTPGAVESDLMKCFGDFKIASFSEDDCELSKQGVERQGNILIPSDVKNKFKEFFLEEIAKLHAKQSEFKNGALSPSVIIKHLGEAINNETSICTWAARNDIAIYSPAFTDGLMGQWLVEYVRKHPGLIINTADDVFLFNKTSYGVKKTGAIVFGGGIIKHHIFNCNLMRNGADYCIIVNTGAEFEASDSGAKPEEALSWGKLKRDCKYSKVYSDVSIVLPLLIAGSFKKHHKRARRVEEWKEYKQSQRL